MRLPLGAGCTARLTWSGGICRIEVNTSTRRASRVVELQWTQAALSQADSEVRHIASRALRLGAPAVEGA